MDKQVIPEDVRDALGTFVFSTPDVGELTTQLKRPLYIKTAKMLKALGGKWSTAKQAFLFATEDALEAIETALNLGYYIDWKQVNQFFETPAEIVENMLNTADVKKGTRMLEPSAGKGAIAGPAYRRGARVTAVEQSDMYTADLCRACPDVIEADFLEGFREVGIGAIFDAIVMNPPFRNLADVQHVMEAWRYLKPGGTLVSVMSPAWSFRTGKRAEHFQEFAHLNHFGWRMLPEGSFKSAGTMVQCGLMVLQK